MGLLSAFCVAAALLMLDRTLGAKPTESGYLGGVWAAGSWYVIITAASLLFGALMFYLQRSKMLWVLGRLAIDLAKEGRLNEETRGEVEKWMFWWQYRIAWAGVLVAAVYVPLALLSPRWPLLSRGQIWMTSPLLVVAIGYARWIRVLFLRDQREERTTARRSRR